MDRNELCSLLQHDTLSYVEQGLFLIETLDFNCDDLQEIIPWTESNSFVEFKSNFQHYPHNNYISLWLLSFLTRKSLHWIHRITSIKCNFAKLSALPETIGNISSLQELFLMGNHLTTLPQSIGQLKNLHTLDVSSNSLDYLPESFGNLSQLQWLNLQNNPIQHLPPTFQNLNRLRYLSLKNLKLNDFPINLENCRSITTLDICNNHIETFPEEALSIKNFIYIGNPIKDLPQNIKSFIIDKMTSPDLIDKLSQFPELQIIDIKRLFGLFPASISKLFHRFHIDKEGHIQWYYQVLYSPFKSAQIRYLQLQAICSVAASKPTQLNSLTILCFLNSSLDTLPDNIGNLQYIPSLKELDFRYCKISELPEGIKHIQQLERLRLAQNPLSNEQRQWLQQHFSRQVLFL